jgi:hypothetical protein
MRVIPLTAKASLLFIFALNFIISPFFVVNDQECQSGFDIPSAARYRVQAT